MTIHTAIKILIWFRMRKYLTTAYSSTQRWRLHKHTRITQPIAFNQRRYGRIEYTIKHANRCFFIVPDRRLTKLLHANLPGREHQCQTCWPPAVSCYDLLRPTSASSAHPWGGSRQQMLPPPSSAAPLAGWPSHAEVWRWLPPFCGPSRKRILYYEANSLSSYLSMEFI